jgi:hypothetical protein
MTQTELGVIERVAPARALSNARPRSGRVRLGRVVFVATSIACVAAVAVDLHKHSYYRTLLYVGVTAGLALIGALLTARMPEHRVSQVIAIAALWWAFANLTYAYAVEALVTDPGSLPGGACGSLFRQLGVVARSRLF